MGGSDHIVGTNLGALNLHSGLPHRVGGLKFSKEIQNLRPLMSGALFKALTRLRALNLRIRPFSLTRSNKSNLHMPLHRATMPSQHDQVSYLRAQHAHREAQLDQVCAERDNHFIREAEVLAHMRLLSS